MKPIGECCPSFIPEKWDNKTHQWENKAFIKASVPTLFHIPLPPMLGKKISELMKIAEKSGNPATKKEDVLLLFNDPTAFKSNIYLSVTDVIPEAKNTSLSGNFISKVYDGPYNHIPKFIKQMKTHLSEQGNTTNTIFVHYAHCPKCAKKAGHNYMVLFAQILNQNSKG